MTGEKQNTTLENGEPLSNVPDFREIDQMTGMQKAYVVLSAEERAKGFVRPVRRTYQHVGKQPKYPLRDLTPEEQTDKWRGGQGWVKFETYPESESPIVGKGWTAAGLKAMHGCGVETTMGAALAETYARDPKFYGSTFCCGCGKHLPVDEFVWKETTETVGS